MAPPAGPPARSARSARSARRRFIVPTERVSARDLIGVAHVVAGAMVIGPALFMLMMNVEHGSAVERATAGAMLLLGGALAGAGLWLRDGQRRGAVLAAVLDGLRLLLLLLTLPRVSAVDLAFTAFLLGGTLWLWPTLSRGPSAAPRRG